MATPRRVSELLRQVIGSFGLSINSSEAELRQALEQAKTGGKMVETTEAGVTVRYARAGRGIFPKVVHAPVTDYFTGEIRWVVDHEWGRGPNERDDELLEALQAILLSDAGLGRYSWVLLEAYGVETLREVEEYLEQIDDGTRPNSPYTASSSESVEVCLRIGGKSFIRLRRSMLHWKAWAEAVHWMFRHPGYEELAPWYYVFQGGGEPCWEMVEVLRFSRWANHQEMARVLGVLARHPRHVDFWTFFGWATGHKTWKVDSEGTVLSQEEYYVRVSYIRELLRQEADLEAMAHDEFWGYNVQLLSYIRDRFFGWNSQFTQLMREHMLVLTREFGLIKAWRVASVPFCYSSEIYTSIVIEANRKLGPDNVRAWMPEPDKVNEWLNSLRDLVPAYQPREGDCFESFEAFKRRAIEDSWGEQVQGWFSQLVGIVGKEQSWEFVLRGSANAHDHLFFIPTMIEKLESYSIKRIIEQADDVMLLAGLVSAYQKDGTCFDGWRQFIKHTNLQRYSIVVPNDDSVLKQAVETVLLAPGIDVSAVRSALREDRFQKLARGEQDRQAFLPPTAKAYYITPTHELIMLALGSRGNAKKYGELRLRLEQIQSVRNKAALNEYLQAKINNPDVKPPVKIDLEVAIPAELEAPVAALLQEYGVTLKEHENLWGALRWATGAAPKAERHKELFAKLNALAKSVGLRGTIELLDHVPEEIEEQVWRILEEYKVPMGVYLKAELLAKSDPRGWVCGNWVVCCMSFGTTKNWDYMYKRTCQYFVVSLVKGEGDERIIAQSVIDATIKAGKTIDPAAATIADIDAWTLDNIEAHNNYRAYFPGIARVYRRFWTTVTRKRVMVGAWHNDLVVEGAVHMPSAQSVRTIWQPLESLSYSDFFGASECTCWLVQEGDADA